MNIISLDHIQLAMPPGKEDEARDFFGRVLGMREDKKPSPLAGRGGCWFCAGVVIIHLGVEKEFSPQEKAHPAFCIEDLDKLASRLTEEEYPVIWDSALPTRRRFYTADPFGNRIEFIQNGDGFTQK